MVCATKLYSNQVSCLTAVENLFDSQWLVNSFQGRSFCLQGLLPEVKFVYLLLLCQDETGRFNFAFRTYTL
ncbi:hypothetical protein CK203_008104 [Vitis vinifera]|uniref:Uncharacterized protein n=1 Tax=Vitis vinifera TaxID=29760 RepID=A0A438KNK1_VITVI|nr:hypothetical protein CK203_008104 [Vitis vinifera]